MNDAEAEDPETMREPPSQEGPPVQGAVRSRPCDWVAIGWLVLVGVAIMAGAIAASILATSALNRLAPGLGHGGLAVIGMLAMQSAVVVLTFVAASGQARAPAAVLALHRPSGGRGVMIRLAAVWIAFLALSTVIATVVFPEAFARDLASFRPLLTSPVWPLAVAVVVIGAPLSEELLFRGLLLTGLVRHGLAFWPAAVLSAGLWTLLHLGYSLPGLAEVFAAGLLLSLSLRATGSLYIPIAIHALYNFAALVIMFTLFA